MEGLAAVAAALLLWAILGEDGKKEKDRLYAPGEIFIGREAEDDESGGRFFVYTLDPFEIVYRGTFQECHSFMKSHIRKE